MRRPYKLIALFVMLLLVLAACGTGGTSNTQSPSTTNSSSSSGNTARSNLHFFVITHGQASDPFWSVVKRGVDQAAKDMGVNVQYEAPNTFDMVAMSRLIDSAVATKPDGLILSIPDANALGPSIQRAITSGIPVISINSGSDVAQKLGVLVHVGQTEYEAGLGGGEKMAAAGVKHALCINQEVGNAGLDARCKGFTDAMVKAGAKVEVLPVNLNNPTQSEQTISAALTSKADVDGLMALGPTGATPALKALKDVNKVGQIKLATFDLSPDVLQAIEQGNMLFAIDQQQYLQGYLPVVLMTLYRTNLNTIANPILMTGPGFVTKDNAARVIQLSQQGTR
jgi:simple sugar transport system substrate-binding protein